MDLLLIPEKQKLKQLAKIYSFEHMRPSPEVFEIQIKQSQYFVDSGDKKRRKIYYKIPYTVQENTQIDKIYARLKRQGIRQSAKWSQEKAIERIKQLIAYHRNTKITEFTSRTEYLLKNGGLYTYGHDRGMRPIMIMRVQRMILDCEIQQNMNMMYYLMLVILGYRAVPYHAEKITTIIDFTNVSLSDLPVKKIYEQIKKINIFYCGFGEKTIVYDLKSFGYVWTIVSSFLSPEQRNRILFVSRGEEHKIYQYIDQYQLQNRFGGKLKDLQIFWPPKSTFQQYEAQRKYDDQSEYMSVFNDFDYFLKNHSPRPSNCGACSCNIY